MNETFTLILDFVAGILLGVIFFGGLWLTVKKVVFFKWSAFWFLGSLFLRTSITLSGFYYISNGELKNLLTGLIGFIFARFIVTRLSRLRENQILFSTRINNEY
jgi:F1F0 ATPase subunit 2